MEFMPAIFKCERISMFPILRVTGMIPQTMPEIEKALLSIAVKIIEIAEMYEGKIMNITEQDNMNDIPKNCAAVRFSMIFKNEDDFQEAVSSIEKGLG